MKRKERQFVALMLMHDRGMRRSFRMRASFFYALLCVIACLPLLAGGLAWLSYNLQQKNNTLRENILRFEDDFRKAQSIAERLGNVETLLNENAVEGKDVLLRRLAASSSPPAEPPAEHPFAASNGEENTPPPQKTEQQEPFRAINTDYIRLENVQVRALRANKLLIALDLHNTDQQKIAAGRVSAALLTTYGARHEINFSPDNVGDFRISRFKRTVMLTELSPQMNPINAQVMIEVRKEDGAVVYRNLFAVER